MFPVGGSSESRVTFKGLGDFFCDLIYWGVDFILGIDAAVYSDALRDSFFEILRIDRSQEPYGWYLCAVSWMSNMTGEWSEVSSSTEFSIWYARFPVFIIGISSMLRELLLSEKWVGVSGAMTIMSCLVPIKRIKALPAGLFNVC